MTDDARSSARRAAPAAGAPLAVLLAGGRGTRLHELTDAEAKPALPFAGRRLADFAVWRALEAGVPRLLALTQHAPDTLHRHLPARWGRSLRLACRDGARVTGDAAGYRGTAHAVAANLAEIEAAAPSVVLVLAGDHATDIDLSALLEAHRRAGAPATVAATAVPLDQARAFGILRTDAQGHALAFREKPDQPPPMPGDPTRALASQGIYAFDPAWLAERLREDLADPASSHDFGHDILPHAVRRGEVRVWRSDGFWRDVGTLDAFRDSWLAIERGEEACALPPGDPALAPAPGPRGLSIETGGLTLRASSFDARRPGRWTVIEDSVVMPGARVAPGARLSRAVVAPGAVVPAGLAIGEDPEEDARWFRVAEGGTTLVTAAMLARRAAERMRLHSLRPVLTGTR